MSKRIAEMNAEQRVLIIQLLSDYKRSLESSDLDTSMVNATLIEIANAREKKVGFALRGRGQVEQ